MLREMAEETCFQIKKMEAMGSVGAVIYDILRVAIGYANEGGELTRFWNLSLRSSRGLFGWIENMTERQKKYINTGYFVVMFK